MKSTRFKSTQFLLLSTLFPVLLSLSACGHEEPTAPTPVPPAAVNPGPAGTNRIIPSLTAEQRSNFCMVYTEVETDPRALTALLETLDGKWKYIPVGSGGVPLTFHFDPAHHHASLTNDDLFKYREDISYRKICVSKALTAEMGALAGYRFIEMMADNNEGGIAFLIKFLPPAGNHSYPTLMMTERVYERWASRNPLETEAAVLQGKLIRTFPNRR